MNRKSKDSIVSYLIDELEKKSRWWMFWVSKKEISRLEFFIAELQGDNYESVNPNDLQLWFGLSRAAWLTLPRSAMTLMPDEWKGRMADLLFEYDESFDWDDLEFTPHVSLKRDGKFVKIPEWVSNYRHPQKELRDRYKGTK